MKKIRFGVIGCGSIANEYHLPALRRVEGAQLVWACDLIEERAQKAKDDFGFEKYTLDYHDILNDSSIDAVCIFTKIEMHATLCIEAAAAGKHIFSQKPFAYNIEEGRKIIRAVDEAGVKLTPSFMHSYMDGSIAARRIVEEGKIGEIRHIRMRNATKNPFDSAPGYGGCMMDIGCHGMDLIHTVAGSSIEEVFALHLSPRDEKRREEFGERANLNGVENTAILNYRLASGATVFHEVFWTQVAQTNRYLSVQSPPQRYRILWLESGRPSPQGYPLAGRPRRPAVLWVHSSQDICGRSAERHEQQQNSARRICAAPGGRGRPALL